MTPEFSEAMETGDRVKYDQTVTIRAYKASQKVHGANLTQCPGGCGHYLTDEENSTHQCPGPRHRTSFQKNKKFDRRAYKRALKEAQKAGKLKEFLDKPW
jgi:hypothetical protein